ncbi:MAG: lycopene cyclase domain-containing protein [Cytophagales bacterium]|nr:lycopene cyclase domain-containing protein [Cytophagales bacterium]
MEKYYYLLINVFTISIPFIRSFEPRVYFISRWKGIFLGISITGAVFIIWDMIFTKMGIWGFNPTYLTGVNIINLPLEEWLFFITIPYACIFIYEAMNYFIKKDILNRFSYPLTYVIITILYILGIVYRLNWYTGFTFIFTASFLLFLLVFVKPAYLGRFYIGYAVSFIPFLLVNGILTGSFIPDEIVWYNDSENLSVRIFTIPVEDSVYMMLLLIMNISIYEWWKDKNNLNTH